MSPLEIPEGPYQIDQVMDSIRAQVVDGSGAAPPRESQPAAEREPATGGALVEDGSPAAQLEARLALARRGQKLDPGYRIQSHRPVVGRVLDVVKRVIHWGARPYADAIRERQERFNEATTQALDEIAVQLEGLRAGQTWAKESLAKAHEAIGAAERLLADSHAQLSRKVFDQADSTRAALQAQTAELGALRQDLGRRIDRYAARYDLGPFFRSVPAAQRLAALEQTRGTEDDIAARQAMYVKLFQGVPGQVLDVGCGRGELLKQLRIQGIECWGAEIDPQMVEVVRAHGNHVVELDALSALRSPLPGKLGGVYAGQVVEHLFPGELLEFLMLARQHLEPGGRIVLETINAGSLGALAKSYFRDIDHKQAIHPEYLKMLLELIGFEQVEVKLLAPFRDDERAPELPDAKALGIPAAARDALQERLDRVGGLLWGPQDFYVTGLQSAQALRTSA